MRTTKDTEGAKATRNRDGLFSTWILFANERFAARFTGRHAHLPLLFAWGLSWFLLSPSQGFCSPASALREYKAGKYDQAFKEYEQLLARKNDDPRLHFNAGAAAYRNRQFEEAAKQFNATQKSRDLKLQGLAYYNEGNALYHLGESNPDPKKKTETWEQALKDFENTLKLNPQDADAKYNLEFVKKRLEELQQQQQQKSQPNKMEPSEAAKRAKAEADEAVRRREYSQALSIMEKQLEQDPTTGYYADYIQRLKEIKGVQEITEH
jgi:tetratricopeptide (TPR) repeat protein